MSARDDLITSLKQEITRTDGKMQALEARTAAREEDLLRIISKLQAAAAAGSGDSTLSPAAEPRRLERTGSESSPPADQSTTANRKFRRASTVVSVEPLLQRSTVLLYNVDSPMMESQTDHIVGRVNALGSFINNVVKLTRSFCDAGHDYSAKGEKLAEALMACR